MRLKRLIGLGVLAASWTYAASAAPGNLYYCGEAGDAELYVELDRFDEARARYYVTIPGGYGDGPTIVDLTLSPDTDQKVYTTETITLSLDAHRTILKDLDATYECTLEAAATPIETVALAYEDLVGTWRVALYFSPNDPPSETVMEITDVTEAGTLLGSFYQSAFESARATRRDGAIIIAATTSDGSGPYTTSGRLVAPDRIEGQTLSVGRDFLMAWTATKE